MNFLKDKVNKHKVLTFILIVVLIGGLVFGGLFITKNKNNSLIEMASGDSSGTIDVPEELQQSELVPESSEATPTQESVEGSSTEGSSNPGTSGSSGQSVPRNNQPQPHPNGDTASGGQPTPAPQQPSTPQPSQPQQQAPSRPQWKKVVVGYCDVTIGYSNGYDEHYKNAESCFQKVFPNKPTYVGVAYATNGNYTCHWENKAYGIDAGTNYVYYSVRA